MSLLYLELEILDFLEYIRGCLCMCVHMYECMYAMYNINETPDSTFANLF